MLLAATPSGFFDFLGLPRELRDRIYRLHLSNECEVNYKFCDDNGNEITCKKTYKQATTRRQRPSRLQTDLQ